MLWNLEDRWENNHPYEVINNVLEYMDSEEDVVCDSHEPYVELEDYICFFETKL